MPLGTARSIGAMAAGMLNQRAETSLFVVEFDNADYDLGSWSKVSGLSVSWDAIEVRNAALGTIWSAPGLPKYGRIKLQRAVCQDSQTVQSWLTEAQHAPKPFSGSIKLLYPAVAGVPGAAAVANLARSNSMPTLVSWTLRAFYPVSWSITELDSKAATLLMEVLELAHTGFLDP